MGSRRACREMRKARVAPRVPPTLTASTATTGANMATAMGVMMLPGTKQTTATA